MVIPLFVGRDKSISALNEVMKKDKKIILVTQKNSEIDDPKKTDVFMYGCEGSILQLLKLPDGTVKVLVEGVKSEESERDNFRCHLPCHDWPQCCRIFKYDLNLNSNQNLSSNLSQSLRLFSLS
jgi:ATP-dependent Lon protease